MQMVLKAPEKLKESSIQVLKGEVPPRDAWQPLLWILVPLHWTP